MAIKLAEPTTFSVRLDEDDRERLEYLQAQTGLSAGEVMRVLIRRGVEIVNADRRRKPEYRKAALRGVPGVSLACPAFYKALLFEAQQKGTREGYRKVGREFARRIFDIYDGGDEAALAALAKVAVRRGLLGAHTNVSVDRVFDWAKTYLPKCIELVPRKRVHAFRSGIEDAIYDRELAPANSPRGKP